MATLGIIWQLMPTYGNFWHHLATVTAQSLRSGHQAKFAIIQIYVLVNACPRICDAPPFKSRQLLQLGKDAIYAVAGAVYWKSVSEENISFDFFSNLNIAISSALLAN